MKRHNHRILRYYQKLSGHTPFLEWLGQLKDSETRYRVLRRLDRLELGLFGDVKSLGGGVSELRLAFGPGYRLYFACFDAVIVVLLCAGDKSSQKKDIKLAKSYWQDLLRRNDE